METGKSLGRRPRRASATPTEILSAEHDLILDVVKTLEHGLDKTAQVDRDVWRDALVFLRSFAAQHHAKENIVLLAALERQGLASSEPSLQNTIEEHREEAALLDAIANLLPELASDDPDVAARFRQAARAYCAHLNAHMEQEARYLFPMVERELSEEDERDVVHRFLLHRHAADGEDGYDRLLALASHLRREA